MTSRFNEAQRRLNLVKANAHEIVGVKREQVHRVVESLSRPGTYDITVHENGRVIHHSWTPPSPDDLQVPARFPVVDEDGVIDELVDDGVGEGDSGVLEEEVPVVEVVEVLEGAVGDPVIEGFVEGIGAEVSAAATPAAPEAPRRRGRPKKS